MQEKNCAVSRAASATVHESKKGAKSLSVDIGIGHQVLLNKVCMSNSSHFLRLIEAIPLMKASRDHRILHAMAGELGGHYIPGASDDEGAHPVIMDDLAKMASNFGQLIREVATDLEDGHITDNELTQIEKDAEGLRNALQRLMRDIQKAHRQQRNKREAA